MGLFEILVIMMLALVVVGPDRLPGLVRTLGRQYGKLMRASDELKRAFVMEAERADADKRAAELRKRREEARQRAEEARKRALEARERGETPEIGPVAQADPSIDPAPLRDPADEGPTATTLAEQALAESLRREAAEAGATAEGPPATPPLPAAAPEAPRQPDELP